MSFVLRNMTSAGFSAFWAVLTNEKQEKIIGSRNSLRIFMIGRFYKSTKETRVPS